MRIPRWLQPIFALPAVLASEVGYTGKRLTEKRHVPDSLMYPVPATLPMGFAWTMLFCQGVTDHSTFTGSADPALFVCRDHSTPPLLGCKHCMGSAGFPCSYADNFRFLARGTGCTDFHLARHISSVQEALASGCANVLCYSGQCVL